MLKAKGALLRGKSQMQHDGKTKTMSVIIYQLETGNLRQNMRGVV